MAHPIAPSRAAFSIDGLNIIRAITWYPMTTGRNVSELLRLLAALQMTDAHGVSTPEGWQPGEDVLLPPPRTIESIYRAQDSGTDWYFKSCRSSEVINGKADTSNDA